VYVLPDAGSVELCYALPQGQQWDPALFAEEIEVKASREVLGRELHYGRVHVVDEVERAIVDAIGAVSSAITDGKYVYGGGSAEEYISKGLREYASNVGGREQLAIQAFAEALEAIPKTLADNAGMDAIDTLVQLRSKQKGREGKVYGVDVYRGTIGDMSRLGIIEPVKIKQQAISSATEASVQILRIDDMISSKGRGHAGPGPGGGMGGMPGGMGED